MFDIIPVLLLVFGIPGLILLALFATLFSRTRTLTREGESLRGELHSLRHRLAKLERGKTAPQTASPQTQESASAAHTAPCVPRPESIRMVPPPPAQRPLPTPTPPTTARPQTPAALVPPPAKAAPAAETSIASRMFVWLGGIAFMFAGFFLIKYSIEQGLFTPGMRLISAALFAFLLLGVAEIFHRRKEGDFIASILAGASVAVTYADAYAASGFYRLIPLPAGFALAVACTAAAVALSFRYGQKLAILALVGGFMAPALFSTGAGSTFLLFSYLIVLTFGLLGIFAARRQVGLALAMLALNFLWVLIWHDTPMYTPGNVLLVLIFLTLLTATYLCFAYRLRAFLQPPERTAQFWALTLPPLLGSLVFALAHTLAAPAQTLCFAYLLTAVYQAFAHRLRDFLNGLKAPYLFRLFTLIPLFASLSLSVLHAIRQADSTGYLLGALVSLAALYAFGMRERKVFHPLLWVPYVALILALVSLRYAIPSYGWLFLIVGLPAALTLALLWRDPANLSRLTLFELLCMTVGGYIVGAQLYMGSLYYSTPVLLALPLLGALHWALYPRLRNRSGEGAHTYLSCVFVCGFALMLAYALMINPAVLKPALFGILAALCARYALRRNLPAAAVCAAIATVCLFWSAQGIILSLKNIFFGAFATKPTWNFCLSWTVAAAGLFAAWHWLRKSEPASLHARYAFAPALALLGVVALLSNYLVSAFPAANAGYAWISAAPLGVLLTGALLTRWGDRTDTFGFFLPGVAVLIAVAARYTLIEESFSPAFNPREVSGIFLLNGFTCSLAIPALVFALVARHAQNTALKIGAGVAALIGFYLYGAMQVRMLFQGPLMCHPYTMPEFYAYSMYTLTYGIVLLVLGYFRQNKVLRIASLVFVLVAVAKVFLLDASQLEGLWRVLSFALLGVCLIGIGYFYARFVFHAGKPQPPTAAPTA